MLSLLHIENIALIEAAEIQFDQGFNVLTGETGAGKSIVIDSIGAVIGERTSRDLIRTGAKKAIVNGVFRALPALPWLEENGISLDEDGSILIQRELQPDGKNICRVNGRLVTVSQLRELGRQLLNIHGQHDGQQLLDEDCHIQYLDSFGGLEVLLQSFRASYDGMMETRRKIASLKMDEAEKSRRIDTLTYQINELEQGDLKLGEEELLADRRAVLRNAGKLMDAVEGAHFALSGGDDSDGALVCLGEAERHLQRVSDVNSEFSELAGKAAELRFAAEDLNEILRGLSSSFDFAPQELDEVESRLDLLFRLKKKYGSTVEEMLKYLEKCRQELDQIQVSDDMILKLEQTVQTQLDEARAWGKKLSAARRTAAERLEKRIQTELAQLDMPKVQFKVVFSEKPGELHMDATGMDQIVFLMSANTGEALKPIQRVASGGELARIMLALKNVLAENDHISTMVFDEVDTGVSGRAAQKVAQKLASVARCKQVLCVTHLPQIAAMADTHFSVEKREEKGRTFTHIQRLAFDQRKEKLAQLTRGETITVSALASAEDLLKDAAEYKAAFVQSDA